MSEKRSLKNKSALSRMDNLGTSTAEARSQTALA